MAHTTSESLSEVHGVSSQRDSLGVAKARAAALRFPSDESLIQSEGQLKCLIDAHRRSRFQMTGKASTRNS